MTTPHSRHDGRNLAATLAPLIADHSGAAIKSALDQLAALGMGGVQLSIATPGLRPRDLDRAARRDLLATLRRRELTLSGLDAWIPAEHFADPARVDRAVGALSEAIALAGDLDCVPVSLHLPSAEELATPLIEQANRQGVPLADHALPSVERAGAGVGVDPAAALAQRVDPVAAVHAAGSRLHAARLVDLQRTGMRGPIAAGPDARLDAREYRIALEVNGYARLVIIDARQWPDPLHGIEACAREWARFALA